MATVKSKYSIGQSVSVIKSGKTGTVVAIIGTKEGTSLDIQVGSAKRPWRYAESALQTTAAAEKAAAAKAKAAAKKPAKPAKAAAPAKAAKPATKAKKAAK